MKTLSVASLLFVLSALCSFADSTNKFHICVQTGGERTNEMASFLKRELRSLSDVVVDDSHYRITLSALVQELIEVGTSHSRGYVAGWVVTRLNSDDEDVLVFHGIVWASTVRELAEKITTQFDNLYLEPGRQSKLARDADKRAAPATLKWEDTLPEPISTNAPAK